MSNLSKLRALDTDRASLDDLVELHAIGRAATLSYQHYSLSTPQWLTDAMERLDKDLQARRKDALLARRRELQNQRDQLRTREERRANIDDELAALERTLGMGQVSGVNQAAPAVADVGSVGPV